MDIPTARCDGLNVCGVPSTSEPWPAVSLKRSLQAAYDPRDLRHAV
jgi:hypothetical protein